MPDTKEDAGAPAKVNLVAIANYFVEFDGIDLEALPPPVRAGFLDAVNGEECPCGCVRDTIARCYINDPGCPVARARLRTIYRQMLEKGTASE